LTFLGIAGTGGGGCFPFTEFDPIFPCVLQLEEDTLVATVSTDRMDALLYLVNAEVDALELEAMEERQFAEVIEDALEASGRLLWTLEGDVARSDERTFCDQRSTFEGETAPFLPLLRAAFPFEDSPGETA
jgi:hypothetical protein